MFTIDLKDCERLAKHVAEVERQMSFVAAYALTNAMKDGREAEIARMRSVFDRPTPYTLNSLQVVPATKARLRAELRFKEFGGTPAWKYLGPEVEGGRRRSKGFENALRRAGILRGDEFLVPSKRLTLNAYGNQPSGLAITILSALGAATDPMQNRALKSRRRTKKPRAQYVVFRNRGKAPDGIYQQKAKFAVPVFLFVKAPTYRKRFPYYEEANRVIGPAFHKHFQIGWDRFVVNGTPKATRRT